MSDSNGAAGRRNLKVASICLGFVVLMGGMAFAAVPLYDMFCRVTGYGGTTQRADAASARVLEDEITIRFDANVSGGLPWDFAPEQRTVRLKVGETGQLAYTALNLAARGTVGTSTFNVSPPAAGQYFNKMECFCFTEQPLDPGETVEMPVVFFIDPAIVDDKDARGLKEITLSYTFFPARDGANREPVAAAPSDGARQPL